MMFWWVLAALGSVCGGLVLMFGFVSANSAPQEAAVAALAAATAIVPYVFARAMQLMGQREADDRRHRELVEALGRLAAVTKPVNGQSAVTPALGGLGSTSPAPQRPPAD